MGTIREIFTWTYLAGLVGQVLFSQRGLRGEEVILEEAHIGH